MSALQAASVAMQQHYGPTQNAQKEHLSRVVQSVTDATKRLSQISTASSNANANTKTSKRKNRDTVGPWKLGKTLGKGSSGRVRLAKNMETGKLSAIKIVPKKFVKSNQAKQLPYGIEREIIIMKLISHPNVMGLYEVWENKSELYLVLEYVEGGELFDYLVSKGKLPESEAVHYFKQIVQGVAYCHGFNICHRDLKPENLLLDKKKKSIKIADFGMAALETSEKLLETSCGSPHYASPEIVLGQKYHGSPSDVWSCGIILFALLTGHLPFNDDNVKKLLLKVQSGRYQMPQSLSREAKDLIARILVVDPKKRITIDQILQHNLLLKYDSKLRSKSNSDLHLLDRIPNTISFKSEQEIDETILGNLQILWHGAAKKTLIARLMKPGFTEEKMFYSLLWNYQEKQQKSTSNIDLPSINTMAASTSSGLQPERTNSSSNVNKNNITPASIPPTIFSFGTSSNETSNTVTAPKLQQKPQFSMMSLKNQTLKSPKRTKQGFIASSSSSRLFQPQFSSKSSLHSITKSGSKKSLTPVSTKKRTLQNSESKRSLYSLQSISKRSINLKELLQEEEEPALPSFSTQNTSSKLESIVDDYDRSTSAHETTVDEAYNRPAFQLTKMRNAKNMLEQPKLNVKEMTYGTEQKQFSSTPLKDRTNVFQAQSFVPSLDPRKNKPKSIESLLRKLSVTERVRSKSALREIRDSGDWMTSENGLFSSEENPLQRQKTNPSKVAGAETCLISTSTPMTNAKHDLLKMPSSLINSSMTFKNLSQFIMDFDEIKESDIGISNPNEHSKAAVTGTYHDTSSNYDDLVPPVNENIDIFEDAPDDANASLTTSESLMDQSQPHLKKKAVSIDSLNTTNILTPATDVRVSLYINQMDKLESLPRETTEELISKFKLSPVKEAKQKRFSSSDRDLTITASIVSVFKDLDNEIIDHRNDLIDGPFSIKIDTLDSDTKEEGKRVTLLFDDRVAESEVFKSIPSPNVTNTNSLRKPSLNTEAVANKMKDSTVVSNARSVKKTAKADKTKSFVSTLPQIEEEIKPVQKGNWFNRILNRLRKQKKNAHRIIYEHKTRIPFDDMHIITMAQFGKNGIDCELKRMERKGDKQMVTYDCCIGGTKYNFVVSIVTDSETTFRIEKKNRSMKDMQMFEKFNEDIANVISVEESKI